MLKNYLKTGLRNMRKNKTYSFLNIFGLAIGIACAGLIFLWVEDELNFDHFNIKNDRLYSVQVNAEYAGNHFTMGSTPRPMAPLIIKEIPGIVNAARISDEGRTLPFTVDGRALFATGRWTDASLFNMFTIQFVEGNPKTAFTQEHSMVITQSAAKKFFQLHEGERIQQSVVGKTILVNKDQLFTVTGVVKDLPQNSTLQFEWLAPTENDSYYNSSLSWGSYGPFTYVELENPSKLESVNKQLLDYFHRKDPTQHTQAFLFPMKDWRLYSEFNNGKPTGSGAIRQVKMLSAIALIILFIACVNFMNLATANSQQRAREIGMRKVLGSGKKRLIFQFIGEAIFLATLSASVAIVFIWLTLPSFNALMQKNLALDLFNWAHLASLLTIVVLCGLVAGSYPALYLSSFNPLNVLKGMRLKTGSAPLIRKGLVVIQFTSSVIFIISTIIVYQQIQLVKNRNLGFDKENLIEVNLPDDFTKSFTALKQDLLHTGLIENVATSDHSTLYGGNTDNNFSWQGKPPGNDLSIAFRKVSPEYISTSGLQLIEGRDFYSNAATDSLNIIITESLAKQMGSGTAVNKILMSGRDKTDGSMEPLTVVGVVKDYVFGSVYDKPGAPVIFLCRTPQFEKLLYLRAKKGARADLVVEKMAGLMKKYSPQFPFSYRFVDDQFSQMFANETRTSKISGIFASLAIIISCLGLFGLAAYTAERRTKEIGIRKVLGASVTGITGLLSKDFLRLVMISCLIAFPIAWWIMHDWLMNYEYRISIHVWIFLAAGAMAILIALFTISFQAVKAALANPVVSLRSE